MAGAPLVRSLGNLRRCSEPCSAHPDGRVTVHTSKRAYSLQRVPSNLEFLHRARGPLEVQTGSLKAFSDVHQGKAEQAQPSPLASIRNARIVNTEPDPPNSIDRTRFQKNALVVCNTKSRGGRDCENFAPLPSTVIGTRFCCQWTHQTRARTFQGPSRRRDSSLGEYGQALIHDHSLGARER